MPVEVKPSRPDRWPSWKIHTNTPNEAVSDSRFITIAFSRSSSDPNARNSSTKVETSAQRAACGSTAAMLSSPSSRYAVVPVTRVLAPTGAGWSRISRVNCLAAAEKASARCVTSTTVLP